MNYFGFIYEWTDILFMEENIQKNLEEKCARRQPKDLVNKYIFEGGLMTMRSFIDITENFRNLKKYIAQGKADVGGRDSLWSSTQMTGLKVTILPDKAFFADEDGLYGQINAHFNSGVWDTNKLGLIYTDSLFERHIKRILKDAGFKYFQDLNYSEQGMQGHDYVNFDVGEKLAAELDKRGLIEIDWSNND